MREVVPTGRILLLSTAVLALAANAAAAGVDEKRPQEGGSSPGTQVVIYPILLQAPIFGADIRLPSLPVNGGDEIDGTTESSLNVALLAGVTVDGRKWFVQSDALYAGLSATRPAPHVTVHTDVGYFHATGGWRVVDGFAITGGVRGLGLDIRAEIGETFDRTVKPRVWDPLVGVDWRHRLGHWSLDVNFEGGGFGVGSDVDISAGVMADWRGPKHLALQFGYGILYDKVTVKEVTVGTLSRSFVAKQTLNGPSIGLGFWF